MYFSFKGTVSFKTSFSLIFLKYKKMSSLFPQTYGTLSNLYINYLIPHAADILTIVLIDHKNGNTVVNH